MMNWPATYDDMHPGAYDANARLEYMDEMGIWAMVMYPNVAGFGNQEFLQARRPRAACWPASRPTTTGRPSGPRPTPAGCSRSRRRRSGTSTPPCGRSGAARRWATAASCSPASRRRSGSRSWATATGTRCGRRRSSSSLPVSFHIGSGDMEDGLGREKVAAYGRMSTFTSGSVDIFLKNGFQLSELLLSGIFVRYPEIQFVSVESGIGWIPFTLEALDYQFHGQPGLRRAPRVRPAAVGVLPDQRARLLLVRADRAAAPDRQDRRRPHHVRDRLPAPDLAVRRRGARARSPPASATATRRPGARSCGRTARSCTRSTEPTPADEEKVAVLAH